MDQKLIQAAEMAGNQLGLSPRFLAAWWISENGWEWPSNNNIGNISYQESGVPSGGVFEGVTRVQDNRVCVYDTEESGVKAFCHLLETPKADKALTLDLSDLKNCNGDIHKMCELVGQSNWASSHYNTNGEGPGSLIWDVYIGSRLAEAFATRPTPETQHELKPEPVSHPVTFSHHKIVVKKGDTLSRLALDHRTTVLALQHLNNIDDPNHIGIGQELLLPLTYQVKPGDTVTKIAKIYGSTVSKVAQMNRINPDFIRVGWHLYV